jgi:hypothetical protein
MEIMPTTLASSSTGRWGEWLSINGVPGGGGNRRPGHDFVDLSFLGVKALENDFARVVTFGHLQPRDNSLTILPALNRSMPGTK